MSCELIIFPVYIGLINSCNSKGVLQKIYCCFHYNGEFRIALVGFNPDLFPNPTFLSQPLGIHRQYLTKPFMHFCQHDFIQNSSNMYF